jgi:hypothetical protein
LGELVNITSFKVGSADLDKITEIEDVDEAYNKFEEVMVNTIDEHAPMKKRKSFHRNMF